MDVNLLSCSVTQDGNSMGDHLLQTEGVDVRGSPLPLGRLLRIGGQEVEVVPHLTD